MPAGGDWDGDGGANDIDRGFENCPFPEPGVPKSPISVPLSAWSSLTAPIFQPPPSGTASTAPSGEYAVSPGEANRALLATWPPCVLNSFTVRCSASVTATLAPSGE